MRWWTPGDGQPELFDWWRPLLLAARRAWVDEVPWPIHIDDFALLGRAERRSKPDVWAYAHHRSRGELYVDNDGQTYKFIPYQSGGGRFAEIDIRTAVWRARLPDYVTPVWFHEPRHRWDEPDDEPGAPVVVRRRGHLAIVR